MVPGMMSDLDASRADHAVRSGFAPTNAPRPPVAAATVPRPEEHRS
jgi:hypothetical protein